MVNVVEDVVGRPGADAQVLKDLGEGVLSAPTEVVLGDQLIGLKNTFLTFYKGSSLMLGHLSVSTPQSPLCTASLPDSIDGAEWIVTIALRTELDKLLELARLLELLADGHWLFIAGILGKRRISIFYQVLK